MASIINTRQERRRFFRFAVVGSIGAVVDFGISNLLIQLLHFPLILAGTISFIAAVINNFIWNRQWTYPDSRSKAVPRQLIEFSLVSLIGLGIRVITLAGLEPNLFRLASRFPQISKNLPIKLFSDNLTLAIAILIVMLWNFFANRYWTYSDVK